MDLIKNTESMEKLKARIYARDKAPGKVTTEDIKKVYEFAQKLTGPQMFSGFVHAVILFGSVARKSEKEASDIDVLVVVDDISMPVTSQVISAYDLAVGKVLIDLGVEKIFHVTTLGLTQFWDSARHGDPVLINILRSGKAIVDTGFFNPLKKLLEVGLIRPSIESVYAHISMAKSLLGATNTHLLACMADLYWGVVDATHAVLMKAGISPPYPLEAPSVFKKYSIDNNIPLKYHEILSDFVRVMKNITHKKVAIISGSDIDAWTKKAEAFIKKAESLIKK